jgi:hypothetical protein
MWRFLFVIQWNLSKRTLLEAENLPERDNQQNTDRTLHLASVFKTTNSTLLTVHASKSSHIHKTTTEELEQILSSDPMNIAARRSSYLAGENDLRAWLAGGRECFGACNYYYSMVHAGMGTTSEIGTITKGKVFL